MVTLSKTIFAMPPQIRQKLFSGDYERLGGIIRDKATGRITYLLVDKLNEEKDGSSVSVSMPEIVDSTLKYLTSGQIRKQLEHLERELDAQNIQIKPEDLDVITGAIDSIHIRNMSEDDLRQVNGNILKLYTRYHEVFSKYLKDLDRPRDYQSFPFIKILILITVIAAKLCMQSGGFTEAREWVHRIYEDTIKAVKAYCLQNSKTDKDMAHFTRIAGYPADVFFDELKEILASPASKPKYKFPPMEAIYLWNCAEYLEGYLLELDSMY